jgi:hypothetical protein
MTTWAGHGPSAQVRARPRHCPHRYLPLTEHPRTGSVNRGEGPIAIEEGLRSSLAPRDRTAATGMSLPHPGSARRGGARRTQHGGASPVPCSGSRSSRHLMAVRCREFPSPKARDLVPEGPGFRCGGEQLRVRNACRPWCSRRPLTSWRRGVIGPEYRYATTCRTSPSEWAMATEVAGGTVADVRGVAVKSPGDRGEPHLPHSSGPVRGE